MRLRYSSVNPIDPPATPAMFINGRRVIGAAEFETLDFLVSRKLAAPQTTWRIGP
jgi:hypothetical protein